MSRRAMDPWSRPIFSVPSFVAGVALTLVVLSAMNNAEHWPAIVQRLHWGSAAPLAFQSVGARERVLLETASAEGITQPKRGSRSHGRAPGASARRSVLVTEVERRAAMIESAHITALVEEIRQRAEPSIRERCVSIVEGRDGSLKDSFSQAYQDWVLFHTYFSRIPYGKGAYLDIGSNHPFFLSNTYFFDKCLGWRGVCVEPNPTYHEKYTQWNRTCTLLKNCLSHTPGKMVFKLDGVLGHLTDKTAAGADEIEVECLGLSDVIRDHDLQHAEMASIDIEGAEEALLRCFPFQAFPIATWLIEDNKSPHVMSSFLRGGYVHAAQLHGDHQTTVPSRAGMSLDSVYRLATAPPARIMLGPAFLPGRPLHRSGPWGPCRVDGTGPCPEQIPVLARHEYWTVGSNGSVRLQNPTHCAPLNPKDFPRLDPTELVHPLIGPDDMFPLPPGMSRSS